MSKDKSLLIMKSSRQYIYKFGTTTLLKECWSSTHLVDMTIMSLPNTYIHCSNKVTEYVGRTHLEINKLNVINQGTRKAVSDSWRG